jgi:hypothetical protein
VLFLRTTHKFSTGELIKMATSHKRGIAEDKERAAATVPTQKWWAGVLLWVGIALVVGALYRVTAPVPGAQELDRWTLLRYAATLLINVTVMYGISYYAARQTLARRSLHEIWNSPSNRDALNRFGLPVLLSVGGLAVLVATQSVTESLFEGLLTASTIFSVYRALTTAYTGHYLDYVISLREVREIKNDREIKGKKRLAWERIAVTLGFSYPRERLVFPLLQTALVVFVPQLIVAFAWMMTGVSFAEMSSSYWLGAVAPALPVVSVVVWATWHLYGGAGRIFRLSSGRSMRSFGWQHPELFTKVK